MLLEVLCHAFAGSVGTVLSAGKEEGRPCCSWVVAVSGDGVAAREGGGSVLKAGWGLFVVNGKERLAGCYSGWAEQREGVTLLILGSVLADWAVQKGRRVCSFVLFWLGG